MKIKRFGKALSQLRQVLISCDACFCFRRFISLAPRPWLHTSPRVCESGFRAASLPPVGFPPYPFCSRGSPVGFSSIPLFSGGSWVPSLVSNSWVPSFGMEKPWQTLPSRHHGVTVYCIKAGGAALASISRENEAFNSAAAQFCKLSQVPITQIIEVCALEYDAVSPVLKRYTQKRESFRAAGKPLTEVYVFHGTGHTENVQNIIVEGTSEVGGDCFVYVCLCRGQGSIS